jgi:hypothetical protein
MPFFSVIIPTYNRATLLQEALASVNAQEWRDFEVIVIDDGSTDETEAVVLASQLPVRFFRQTNAGPGAARNLGIRQATGRYITFLDSDDKWFPWTLKVFQQAFARGREPTFLSGFGSGQDEPVENHAGTAGTGVLKLTQYASMLDACTDRTPPVGGTPSICVERTAVLQAGGFVEKRINGEDTDLWLRLGASPSFVRILQPPVFWQRRHEGSVTRQLEPAVAGAWHLLEQERRKIYPGGVPCRRKRRRIICGTLRSVSLDCLDQGRVTEAFRLYGASFAWNFLLGNLKYLAGFPLAACRKGQR